MAKSCGKQSAIKHAALMSRFEETVEVIRLSSEQARDDMNLIIAKMLEFEVVPEWCSVVKV